MPFHFSALSMKPLLFAARRSKTICFIVIILFINGFLTGCNKEPYTEEQRKEDYEINKENSLGLFSSVMYNNSDNIRQELFKLVHISDAHVSAWSNGNNVHSTPKNLMEAVRFANEAVFRINAMVATGDHIDNNLNTSRSEAMSFLNVVTNTLYKNNQIPTFTSTGNHDVNMMNPNFEAFAISKTEIYDLLTSHINYPIHTDGIENYYYADLENPMGGVVRIIALDVTDQDNMVYDAQHNAILSQKQIDWLCHTALKKDMTDQHSVIVLIHHPQPPVSDEAMQIIYNNEFLYNWSMLPGIIEAFRTKQTLAGKYWNKLLTSDTIFVNVSFNDSPGEFICYLGGHLHTYLNYEVRSAAIQSNLPRQIMIIANNMSPNNKNPKTLIERDNRLRNNTFNLYAIDTKKKIIYVTFFGATWFHYPQVIELHYL